MNKPKTEDWTSTIDELEAFFATKTLPKTISFKKGTIIDPKSFIASHISMARYNNGNKIFKQYLTRLQELKTIIGG
jgi:hypothetical protein